MFIIAYSQHSHINTDSGPHILGFVLDWHWYQQQKKHEAGYHPQIIRFFGDQPIESCPFSLHKLVQIGLQLGKQPGEWYGPSSMAHIFR